MSAPQRRTRIAPTPSGFLHEGNAVNFALTALHAQSVGAQVVLRIDDYDVARMRAEYLADIFDMVEWLGIDIDEGPSGPGEFDREWSSRHRLDRYRAALESLGEAAYACVCSRRQIAEATPDGTYPGTCRRAGFTWARDESAVRITAPDGLALGDFIVWRRDGLPAYQLASVVDDEALGITDVVRGEDLRASTEAQLHLAGLLGLDGFSRATFVHHELLTGSDGSKLSKSAGAASAPLERSEASRRRIWDAARRLAQQ